MADFQSAFKQGLRASEEAGLARKEIEGVFDEFARQVSAASGQRIRVERQQVRRESGAKRTFYDIASGVRRDYETASVLVASAAGSKSSHELCEYELSPAGYPVVLRYADVIDECLRKQSLEEGLENLLAAPQTGDKLRQLLQFAPPPADPDPAP